MEGVKMEGLNYQLVNKAVNKGTIHVKCVTLVFTLLLLSIDRV